MEGIRKHQIDLAVVVRRKESYYLPPDEACFAPLLKTYPEAFRAVYEGPDFRIFEVAPRAVVLTKGHL